MVVRVDETALRALKKGASNRIQYRIPRDHCGVVERERETERQRERERETERETKPKTAIP